MRRIFLIWLSITSLLPAASTEVIADRLATGFIAQPAAGHYWAMSSSYRASFDPKGVHLVRHGQRATIRFPGARLLWQAEGKSPAQVHFLGAESRSFGGAAALRAHNAYPGVDIVVRLRDGSLKSEFQMAAGVSSSVAGYCLDGATARAGADGQSLRIDAGGGWQWTEEGLESWQDSAGGSRIPVPSRFRVDGQCVRFDLANVDPSLPLTIDPELTFSSYLGGGMFDAITAIATDAQGNIYLGGWTESSDFPGLSGYQPATGGRIDGFVAKVNAAGQLVFSTYLGGAGEDRVQAIVVDGAGVITVAGLTSSINFPLLSPARGALAGGRDAFITRLYPAGNQLVFSTYMGGTAHDSALAITLDFSGNIIVAGETASTDFPTQAAYSTASGGGVDGFLSRFSPTGALLSSTYFGGGSDDRIRGVAVSGDGVLHVTGSTASGNFPVAAAPYPSLRGSMDAFYTRFNSAASGISLSTYLGGAGGSSLSEEAGYAISIDTLGRAWIAGVTPSIDFPGVSNGHQNIYGGGGADAFVTVFTAAGSLEWSTYIGGTGLDAATSISAGSGFVGLAGYTTSNNLPVTGALQSARAGEYDAFWAAYPIVSTAPLYISYIGGSGSDSALAAAASGSALAIGGSTLSANFPVQSPIQSSNPGSYGGFASRLRFGPGPITVSPASGAGLGATFTFSISHANGSATIQNAAFLFNGSYSFTAGCYVYYDRGANVVSLYKDAGGVWLPLTPGAAATVDNGVCIISGTGLTVSNSVNSLILTLPVTFATSFGGTKNIYANANDTASLGAGWPQAGTWDILGPTAPAVGGVTPAAGNGVAQTFTATFTDANGGADIASLQFLVNSSVNPPNGCYITFNRSANTASLFRDTDAAWLPLTPGSALAVSNDFCTLSGVGMAATAAGNSLSLTIPLAFKQTFTGAKILFAGATDAGGLTSGLVASGTWNLNQTASPTITSLTPSSGSAQSQTFSVALSDFNGHADISSALLLVNSSLNGANGCFISYNRSVNAFYLFRDSDNVWLVIYPGSAASISNANCTLSGAALAASASGTSLTLSLPITFGATFTGVKNFYANVSDAAGLSSGWITAGTWNPSPPAAPTVTSLSPSSGSGVIQSFTITLADANGNGDIASALFIVNSAINGQNSCFISYNHSANAFYLFKDAGSVWQLVYPGSSVTVSNPNCSLAGAGLTRTVSGNSVTITLPLSFGSSYTGPKNFYAYVTDSGSLSSGWVTAGTWSTAQPAAPAVTSVSPSSGAGPSQLFTITLTDTNGNSDIASALLLLNGTLDGQNACFISYNRSANAFYLYRDSGNVWQLIYPGSGGSVTNGNCTISGATLASSASGTTVTLTVPLAFSSGYAGTKNFYATAADAGGLSSGWIIAGTWNPAQAVGPTVTSVSPSSGAGAAQTFSLTFADGNGNADVASALVLINNALNGNNACFISYNRSVNAFYLLRDSDGVWQVIYPGGAGSVTNNSCTLTGAGLASVASGNSLTLTLPLSFKPGFAGARSFFATATDSTGLTSGWIVAGTWVVN